MFTLYNFICFHLVDLSWGASFPDSTEPGFFSSIFFTLKKYDRATNVRIVHGTTNKSSSLDMGFLGMLPIPY